MNIYQVRRYDTSTDVGRILAEHLELGTVQEFQGEHYQLKLVTFENQSVESLWELIEHTDKDDCECKSCCLMQMHRDLSMWHHPSNQEYRDEEPNQ